MAAVRRLPAGPLDVVGDVHGDAAGLSALLERLGYGADGAHPEGRRLVFVGDLVDRGPDSLGVLDRLRGLLAAGHQAIIGNHELNLLMGLRRHGSDWFWALDDRSSVLDLFASLPVALERADLRVVHACWSSVDRLREVSGPLADSVRAADATIERAVGPKAAVAEGIRATLDARPDAIDDTYVEVALARQEASAVRLATSGPEERAEAPFHAGGRWRMVRRSRWWRSYTDEVPLVFGHYWRTTTDQVDPFDEDPPFAWLGPRGNAFCVDYTGRVAALRVPEWRLVFEDGQSVDLGPPG